MLLYRMTPWVDSAMSLLCAFLDSLLLRKQSIKLHIRVGSELVEPATTGPSRLLQSIIVSPSQLLQGVVVEHQRGYVPSRFFRTIIGSDNTIR